MLVRLLSLLSVSFLLFAPSSAQAAQPRLLDIYGDWSAHTYVEDGKKVCFMSSRPTQSEGKYSRRGEIFAYVTHRPAENSKNVFSFVTGYDYKSGSDVKLSFGNKTVTLFTQSDKAWAVDEKTDALITDLIKRKNTFVVRGTSSRGTQTKDTFSLKGSTKAYARISKECGR